MEQVEGQKKPRGFAALSAEQRTSVARAGNRRLRELGLAHHFTSEQAKAAAQKGGFAVYWRKRKAAQAR